MLQTSQFLVKNCVLISSCSLFTKNINLGFHFIINTDFMPKNSHFFSFSLFSGLFSLRGEVEIFFWGKNLLNDVSKTILNAKIISFKYLKSVFYVFKSVLVSNRKQFYRYFLLFFEKSRKLALTKKWE